MNAIPTYDFNLHGFTEDKRTATQNTILLIPGVKNAQFGRSSSEPYEQLRVTFVPPLDLDVQESILKQALAIPLEIVPVRI